MRGFEMARESGKSQAKPVSRSCLNCGIERSVVRAVRRAEGYTLGCGIVTTSENGTEFDEIASHHRWAPWSDGELAAMALRPEVFDRYRTSTWTDVMWAPCGDSLRGHSFGAFPDLGIDPDECFLCGWNRRLEKTDEPES